MPILIIAIWKCGAVYVPLDARQPVPRLKTLIARVQPAAVVALDNRDNLAGDTPLITRADLDETFNQPAACELRPAPRSGDDLAYIMFTSGSTGEPKGVEITIANLTSYFVAHNEVLQFTPESRVFSLSPYHFDVSIEDTILPLSLGAFVFQFRSVHAGAIMRAVIKRERITHLIAVSTLLTLITGNGESITESELPHIRMVMTGAEVCDPQVMSLWKQRLPLARVINAYGPTEATIVCMSFTLRKPDPDRVTSYPIGQPLRGVHARIVDETDAAITTVGPTGELLIGGDQVMRGYFDRPDQTRSHIVEFDGIRYYRSGDICCYDDHGDIVFVGRLDDEVKLAGRRIHLGEIRELTLSAPGVDRAAVAMIEHRGRDIIALAVVAPEEGILSRLETLFAAVMPDFMRPSIIGWSSAHSLLSSGKTDERQLIKELSRAADLHRGSNVFAMAANGRFEPADRGHHV